MPRWAAKIDDNQREIADALLAVGASVQSLAAVGKGCPDLLVGYRGRNFLLEIKDGSKIKSQRQLSEGQKVWHQAWRGEKVAVVEGVPEALEAIGCKAHNANS